MALQVGELNGIITIDDRAVDPALRRTEEALRNTGQQMGDDAERAGRQAGEGLGEGLTRGADGRLRDGRGRFVRTARQTGEDAGDALGDGLTTNAGEGADGAVAEAGGRLEKLKSVAGGAAAAAGAAAGALLIDAFGQALEQGKITAKLGASMGKTPAEAQRYGKVAGQLYADAVTEDFQGAADAIGVIMAAGLVPPDATNAQIKSIAANAHDLSDTFELDLGQAANAAGQLIKTGLAKNSQEAFDVMTRGMQVMGPRADDLADTFNEYSTIFRQMGISATDATGLLAQGMAAGARDTDVVADSLKEFTLIAQGGGKAVDEAFKKIHLSGKDMQDAFTKGGPAAKKALDQVFDGMRKVKDPTDRAQIALALFGTKAEDMQKALFSLDPSEAADALGKVGGAADKMGNSIRDNAATQIEQFKRGAMQGLVDFLGGKVIPALTDVQGAVSTTFGGLWAEAAKGAGGSGVDQFINLFPLLGKRIVQKVGELAPQMIGALTGAGESVAAWVVANPTKVLKIAAIAAAITLALVSLPLLAGAAITSSAAMIMLGFGKKLVEFLIQNVPAWWTAFTGWVSSKASQAGTVMTVLGAAIGLWFASLWSRYISGPVSGAWNSFITTVRGLPGRATGALASLGASLAARASSAWTSFHNATAKKVIGFISYVKGLPGRISGAIGSLSDLLTEKGRNVVQGLWNGISGMGDWIKTKITGWAKSVIPGPIAKALGIASPSKVTKAQGRWIARGLVDGLTGSGKQVRAASTKLADIIADSLKPGKKRSKALGRVSADSKRLLKLAAQEDRLAARMKTASKSLADQIKNRDKLAADVKKGVLDSANITSQDTGGWPQTAETILAGLQQDRVAAERFAKNLAQLRKKGVRSDLIAQIAQAGVEQGSSAAAALANATPGQIKQINKEQAALVTAAGNAGATAGNAMYGAGINAAQGLIRGLQSQQKAIDKQMLTIAKGMSKAIRKALGIKSPSRVMALVGAHTAEGLRQGIESGRTAVNRSMSSLVETPSPGSLGWAGAGGRGAGVQRTVLEIRSSGRKQDDMQLEMLRGSIRNKSGGNVELALAGRRGA